MELTPEFYTENPFQLDENFRVAGASKMNTKDLYALFIKNMIAFVYFETDFHNCEMLCDNPFAGPDEVGQIHLYQSFLIGNLTTQFYDSVCCSPLLNFFYYENHVYSASTSIDAICYRDFIAKHLAVFARIDSLVDLTAGPEAGNGFLTYLSAYDIIYPHLNVISIGNALEAYFIAACKSLCCSYIHYSDESAFLSESFQKEIETVFLTMKFDLLDKEEQEKIIVYSKRWLTHRFKEFAIKKHLQFAIHETEGAFIFTSVLEQFSTYFSFAVPKNTTKEYPTFIFSSYEAFLLFDTLAKGLSIKVAVSYVYRLLYENDLIVVKDTPFRTWFNKQSYSIKLTTATETLQKSTSSEREQYVALVAKLLGVSI